MLEPTADPPAILSGDQLQARSAPEVPWLIRPYVPRAGVILLFGKYSVFKTPLAAGIAHAIASGRPLWGLPAMAGRVLFLENDTPEVVVLPRLQQLDWRGTQSSFVFRYGQWEVLRPGREEHAFFDSLAAAHAAAPFDLVVIDCLRATTSAPLKDSETPGAIYGAFGRLFPGAALLFIHHSHKLWQEATEEQKDEDFSGSHALADRATVALKITRRPKREDAVLLRMVKSQASELAPDRPLTAIRQGSILVAEDDDDVRTIVAGLPPGLSAQEGDREIARVLGCSVRTAQRRRLALAAENLT